MKKYNTDLKETALYFLNNKKYGYQIWLDLVNVQISDLFKDDIIYPIEYNIFGCPESTDVDIAIKVDKIVNDNLINLDLIKSKLPLNKIDKEIDFVQIKLDENGKFLEASKGSKEIQNMIYYTYHYHEQSCNIFFNKPLEHVDELDKCLSLAKFVFDYIPTIDPKKKKMYYIYPLQRLDYAIELLLDYKIIELNTFVKSISMKIMQLIIVNKHPEYISFIYSKLSLSNIISKIYNFDNNLITGLLFRGKNNINYDLILDLINDIFHQLVILYKDISLNIIKLYEFNGIDIILDYDESNELYNEFLISPIEPSNRFIEIIKSKNTRSFNLLFQQITNYLDVQDYLDKDYVIKHIDLCNQRSTEWLNLIKFYGCSKSIIIDDKHLTDEEYIKKYYYLCRGSISELLIINYIDFSKILGYEVIKFNCGLVVESKDIPNSRAICPDLLLIKKENKKIIPVEIKCFIGSNEFTLGLAREIKLARLQLKTISELLKEHYIGYSLMIIMFINDRDIKIQYIIL